MVEHLKDVLPAVIFALGAGGCLEEEKTARKAAERFGLGKYKRACVVLVDGLGFHNLQARSGHAATLRNSAILKGQTCLPSTTAAAITTFGTGSLPGQTGMGGYSIYEPSCGGLINLLTFEGATVSAAQWQQVPTLFERVPHLKPVAVTPAAFVGSGLTMAALRGTEHALAEKPADRIEAALNALRRGSQLVYLYWRDLDHAGHPYGWESNRWTARLEELDVQLAALARRLPKDTLLIVTADHGMIDTSPKRRIDLAECPHLAANVKILAGEPRAVHVHTDTQNTPEMDKKLREIWQTELGEKAYVYSPQEASERMGGNRVNVGAALVCCKENWVIVDSRSQSPGMISLIGVHGSITEMETEIPIITVVG